ncbi:hypothetical protein NA57DRAFT_61550 [Rhizodiscina lignyota]|uniref:Uncharacterized protein n=1 Tax=Rhizodiscina lignyota TaxID=1504668 RepID=A0A9P4I804_9PEZI|nr:hypothetical protein NA57DRAFT_61550 [Rhizodiscina lignyota]
MGDNYDSYSDRMVYLGTYRKREGEQRSLKAATFRMKEGGRFGIEPPDSPGRGTAAYQKHNRQSGPQAGAHELDGSNTQRSAQQSAIPLRRPNRSHAKHETKPRNRDNDGLGSGLSSGDGKRRTLRVSDRYPVDTGAVLGATYRRDRSPVDTRVPIEGGTSRKYADARTHGDQGTTYYGRTIKHKEHHRNNQRKEPSSFCCF